MFKVLWLVAIGTLQLALHAAGCAAQNSTATESSEANELPDKARHPPMIHIPRS